MSKGESIALSTEIDAAAALHDLQRLRVVVRFQLAVEAREIARHHRADVGVQHGRGGALVLAPLRRDVDRARDEDARRRPLAPSPSPAARDPGSGTTTGSRSRSPRSLPRRACGSRASASTSFSATTTSPKQSTRSRDAVDEALRHDRIGLVALGEVQDLGDVARGHAARAAHDVDGVLVALGGDQADFRALALDQGVGADGRAVGEDRNALAEKRRTAARAARRRPASHRACRRRSCPGSKAALVAVMLPARSRTTQSVKVPPMSTPTRYGPNATPSPVVLLPARR